MGLTAATRPKASRFISNRKPFTFSLLPGPPGSTEPTRRGRRGGGAAAAGGWRGEVAIVYERGSESKVAGSDAEFSEGFTRLARRLVTVCSPLLFVMKSLKSQICALGSWRKTAARMA